jgi:pimeloyl-ACP methyl ester carboxylesterase
VWGPLIDTLAAANDVLAVDLPGHGDSPSTSYTPPEWAEEVAAFLDGQGLERVAILGHSSGGWTGLELAKLGRAESVLALAPAGLWRKHSPLLTDITLNVNWRLGRLLGPLALRTLRSPLLRSISLRSISAKPRDVPADVAIANARAAMATDSFPRHFSETRRLRFQGGQDIKVPIKVVWGEEDHIALAGKSRSVEELPSQVEVETWSGCGHMLMWDAPDRVLETVHGLRP